MAQKNAFIIDEDREFALTVAAALRADGLKVSISEGDRDPLDEIRAERPDIVLVRAESSGKESGYTLVSRVKRNKRTQATPVFLYTSDQNLQTIETHKTKDTRADDYLVLPPQPPYPLDELRERVRNILFPPGGLDRPPPLPPAPKEDLKPVTQEDSAFIEKVMDSLQSSRELEEPPSAAALKAGAGSQIARRTTADAKLDMLREKLRQRESDLSRVMEMYRAKEREYHLFHERLVEKDVEAQSLKMTIDELAGQLEITKEELERRTNEFNASFELLLEEKVNRENELIQVVAAKEKELQDQRSEMWDAERTAKVRIDALESTLAELDQEKHKLEQDIFVLKETIAEREGAIEALRQELDDAAQRQRDLEHVRDDQVSKILSHEDRMLRLEETILELRSDLSAEREAADLDHEDLSRAIAAKEALVDGLRSDLTDAEDAFRSLDAELHGQIADLEAKLDARERELSQTLEAKAEVERALAETEASWAANKDDLETQLAARSSELDAERVAR
ncbi:hypothetical protein L6R52_24660, partial [Myxococcota bacterium]|nr:hypothetical protein [Myxococcota bacterium]